MIVVLSVMRTNRGGQRWRATETYRVPEDSDVNTAKRQALKAAEKLKVEVERISSTMPDEGQRVDHDLTK